MMTDRLKVAHINIGVKNNEDLNNKHKMKYVLETFQDYDIIGITEAGIKTKEMTYDTTRYNALGTTSDPNTNNSLLLLINKDWSFTQLNTHIPRSKSARIRLTQVLTVDIHLIYGPPDQREKTEYWKKWKRYLKANPPERTILIGDFNETIDPNLDRITKNEDKPNHDHHHLTELINTTGLIDLYRFTHNDKRRFTYHRFYQDGTTSHSRIDHIIVGSEIADKAGMKIHTHDRGLSPDHSAISADFKIEVENKKLKDRVDPEEIKITRVNLKELKEKKGQYISLLHDELRNDPIMTNPDTPAHTLSDTLSETLIRVATLAAGTKEKTINGKPATSENKKTDRLRGYLKRLSKAIASASRLQQGQTPTKKIRKLESNPEAYREPPPIDGDWKNWITRTMETQSKVIAEINRIQTEITRKRIKDKVERLLKSERTDTKLFFRKAKPYTNKGGLATVQTQEGTRTGNPEKVKLEVRRVWSNEFKRKDLPWDGEKGWWKNPKIKQIRDEVQRTDTTNGDFTKEEIENYLNERGTEEKSPGPDDIPIELYALASEIVAPYLARIFNNIKNGQDIPEPWRRSKIYLIYKDGTNSSEENPLDYRPISLLCTGYKILTALIDKRIRRVHERLFTNLQGGFRTGRTCAHKTRVLTTIIEDACRHNKQIHILYLDCRKAFDTVPREAILETLRQLGYNHTITNLIERLYEANTATVITPHGETYPFDLESGVKQGCPLSPLLFILFLEPLLIHLDAQGKGYTMSAPANDGDPVELITQAFADDQLLVAESHGDIQELLDLTTDFMNTYGMELSIGKAKTAYTTNDPTPRTLTYKKTTHHLTEDLSLTSVTTEIAIPLLAPDEAYRYLGIWISISMGWTKQKEMLKHQIWLFLDHIKTRCYTPQQKITLINKILISAIDYRLHIADIDTKTLEGWTKWIARSAARLLEWDYRDGYKAILFPKEKGGAGLPDLSDMALTAQTSSIITFGLNGTDIDTRRCLEASRNSENPPIFWKKLESQLKTNGISILQAPAPCRINSIRHFSHRDIYPEIKNTKIDHFLGKTENGELPTYQQYNRRLNHQSGYNWQHEFYRLQKEVTDFEDPLRAQTLESHAKGEKSLKRENFEEDIDGYSMAWTDGSYLPETGRAGSAFCTHSREGQGQDFISPSPNARNSFDAEAYALWMLLTLTADQVNLRIYTDSKSVIDAVNNTKSDKWVRKTPNSQVILQIKQIIEERAAKNTDIQLKHCYSHTLDSPKEATPEQKRKQKTGMDKMKNRYGARWKRIALGNKKADSRAGIAAEQTPIRNLSIRIDKPVVLATPSGHYTTGVRTLLKEQLRKKIHSAADRKAKEKLKTTLTKEQIPGLLMGDYTDSRTQTFGLRLLWNHLKTPTTMHHRLPTIIRNERLSEKQKETIQKTYSSPNCTFGCPHKEDRTHMLTCIENPAPALETELTRILTKNAPNGKWRQHPLFIQSLFVRPEHNPWKLEPEGLVAGILPPNLKHYLGIPRKKTRETLTKIHLEYLESIRTRYLASGDQRHNRDPTEGIKRRAEARERREQGHQDRNAPQPKDRRNRAERSSRRLPHTNTTVARTQEQRHREGTEATNYHNDRNPQEEPNTSTSGTQQPQQPTQSINPSNPPNTFL